jgi:2'-5' RNA ligase
VTRESALLVAIPETEPLVASIRAKHDPAAGVGVPAHVTLLYPFMPPPVEGPTRIALRHRFGRVTPFDVTFRHCRRFDERVLWLAPEPAAPLVSLMAELATAFPGYLPYGGAFDDVVPHLTVAEGAEPGIMDDIEEALRTRLPVAGRVTEALLMEEGDDGMWRSSDTFAFAH